MHSTWSRITHISRRLAPALILMTGITGCATQRPAPEPRVSMPTVSSAPKTDPIEAEKMSGEFVQFGKLRTVIRAQEHIINQNGAQTAVREIEPDLERALVQRDFRIFSGAVAPANSIAEVTRNTHAHLVIDLDAKSEFVNTTGRFSRYRALADVKAIRGRDGTILAANRVEELGDRHQDDERAGRLALRKIAEPATEQLIRDLVSKSDQLLWAGIIINQVPTMDRATEIQRMLEQKPYIDHVELLSWDRRSMEATYEVIYGLKHESDIARLLGEIPQLRIRPSRYEPGRMEVLRRVVSNYK